MENGLRENNTEYVASPVNRGKGEGKSYYAYSGMLVGWVAFLLRRRRKKKKKKKKEERY